MAKLKNKPAVSPEQIKNATAALEVLFATDYINKRSLYKANFIRGLFFSMGTVVGAAIIVTVLLWLLSVMHSIPLVRPVSENLRNSIEQQSSR